MDRRPLEAPITLNPTPSDKFTFGLWAVGSVARNPFGEPTRQPLKPTYTVGKFASLGAYSVSLHDNNLVPHGASTEERERTVWEFLLVSR